MDIQPAGSLTPLNETSAESATPQESPSVRSPLPPPFQDDSIVSYSPPGLDLGNSPTPPAEVPPGGGQRADEQGEGFVTAFEQFDQKANQLLNILSSVLKQDKEEEQGTTENKT